MRQSSAKSIDLKDLISNNKVLESHILSILDSIPDALLITESDNHISFFNNTFVQLWQIPAEIIKTYNRDLIFSYLDSRINIEAYFIEKVAYLNLNLTEASFELLELLNGTNIECYTWPRWVDNKIAGRIWSFRDVTQQKRIEDILKKQKQELVNAHRIASLGSWTYNVRTKEFKLSESMSQICEGTLVRNSLEDFIKVAHTEDQEMVRQFFSNIVLKGTEINYDLKYRVVTIGERTYYVRTVVEVIYILGKPKLLLGTIQDITKQAFLEISLASAKEAAEDYNLAKGIFLANMSHEMRTPLNAILGYAEILRQMPGTNAQMDYINSIKSSGESLLALVEDVLYISRVDEQKIVINADEVNLNLLKKELYGLFRYQFEEKRIKFNIDINEIGHIAIYIDKARLKQILINIISNALKFTKSGYVYVTINIRKIVGEKKVDLTIYVEDTGIGIDENYKDKIFESFRQLEDKDKRNFEGIGLGLYITKKNVELLGGSIEVQSKVNAGSVFIVTFRNLNIADHVVLPDEFTDPDSANERQKVNLLIADDREFNRRILSCLTTKFDINILEANNGLEAVEIAVKYKPSAIVMDLEMPEMDGYEATKVIRTNSEINRIPIIAYCPYDNLPDKKALKAAGFNDFIVKPVSCVKAIETLSQFFLLKVTDNHSENKDQDHRYDAQLEQLLLNHELIDNLKNSLSESWNQLSKVKSLKNQRELAKSLAIFGSEYQQEFIMEMGTSLLHALNMYNIEETNKIINKVDLIFEAKNG